MLASNFRSTLRTSFRSILSDRPLRAGIRVAATALLLALACSEPTLAAGSDPGAPSWWTLLGLPGFLNW